MLAPIAVLLAYDAYRALGHRIRDRYPVISSGLFARRAVALERQAIIGWSISRSFLQRRSGLITLGAITAAGEGLYKIRDVSPSHGLATAEEAMPGILTPFIERVPQQR